MMVLIVDDEPGLPELMAEILGREGFATVTATSLAEARRQRGPFDVVIADVRLPNGDGRELRAEYPETPFVVISGWGDKNDSAEPFFLHKPFSAFQLRHTVQKAVGHV